MSCRSFGDSISRFLILGFATILALTGALTIPSTTRAAEPPGLQTVATVTSETRVWLREKAAGDAKVVSKIESGTRVTLLAGPKNGWHFVKPAGTTYEKAGWVKADRIIFDQDATLASASTLRSKPFVDSSALSHLSAGTIVSIAGPKVGEYLTVKFGDEIGFVERNSIESSTDTPLMAPIAAPTGERWVDVNRSTSTVSLMVGSTPVAEITAAVSRDQSNGFYGTAVGSYRVYEKVKELQYTPYADAYFTYWTGFDPDRFNGFHSWTMDGTGELLDGGWGPTSGCVSSSPSDAKRIFNFVRIGTRVEVHW